MKRALLILLLFTGTARAGLSLDMRQWLPANWQSAAVNVTVTPFMPYDGWPGLYFLGWTDVEHARIYLRLGYEDATFAHEAGHAIWHRSLTAAQKRAWRHVHWSHPNSHGVFVYPKEPAHSFAECFSDYVTKPRTLLRNEPDVYEFFRVNSGSEFIQRKVDP